MNRITEQNFKECYPQLKEALINASFIAIDAEFSGIHCENKDVSNESLFDSPKERYSKLKKNIEPFIAIQIGLTAFTREKHDNKYRAESFDFHLLPRPLPTRNRTFLIQASAVEFLSTYKFDFNQLAYNGISYLDEKDEVKLNAILNGKRSLWDSGDFYSINDRDEVENYFKSVQTWLGETTNEEKVLQMQASNWPVRYLAQKELRRCIKGIWTESLESTKFSVIRVSPDVRKCLEEKDDAERLLEKELLDYYVGFSKVFKLITSLKKPIVGHNLLLDLMFMHKQFFRPLPGKYETFKDNVNRLFPLVYDTKFLSCEMKNVLNRVSWKSNVLANLYTYFKDGPGRYLAMNSPVITLTGSLTSENSETDKFHDAGWDSYCTGYCFIRMAHVFATKKLSKDADLRILTNAEIMSGVKERANRINLIRADLSHLIAQTLSRFGIVDVRRYVGNGVLVAVPNHGAARDILKFYEGNTEFRVVSYDPWMTRFRTIKAISWVGGALVSGAAGIFAWMIFRRGSFSRD